MSARSIAEKGCKIVFGQKDSGRFYCKIISIRGRQFGFADKIIEAVEINDLWWIIKKQILDILLRGGLTVEDLLPIEKAVAEAHYLAENHARLLNGHEAETKEDYAILYREMERDLDEIEHCANGLRPSV